MNRAEAAANFVNRDPANQRIVQSGGAMFTIVSYLDRREKIRLQALNKQFYNETSQRAIISLVMPHVTLIFENARKQVYVGLWRKNIRYCETK